MGGLTRAFRVLDAEPSWFGTVQLLEDPPISHFQPRLQRYLRLPLYDLS